MVDMSGKIGYFSRSRCWLLWLAIATILISIACSNKIDPELKTTQNSVSETTALNIWWEQGYNLEEDEAVRNIVARWQDLTGNQVKLSFFSSDELTAKAERAVRAGNPPDILMDSKADRLLYPRLAWEGKLEDVTDIIAPIEDDYGATTLKAISYYNSSQGKRSYYGVPIDRMTIFIFYWQDLLASVGVSADDLPQDWDNFWQFWQQAQTKLKTEENIDLYALGFPLAGSNNATDTYYLFEQILEAYNIDLLNDRGELTIDRPEVRQGIIRCLDWYARLYRQGYIPPDAVRWSNPSNNRSLLNRLVLMTPNITFSIPATVSQDRDTYLNRLGVVEFPRKPSGEPMRHLVAIRQAVIFSDSPYKSPAKEFLRYLIQPQIAIDYLQASSNRTQPVRTSVWLDSGWQDTQDPYIAKAKKILTPGQTRLFYTVERPAYSQVLAENVWGKAVNKVTAEGADPQQTADEAIARIKEIFAQWD